MCSCRYWQNIQYAWYSRTAGHHGTNAGRYLQYAGKIRWKTDLQHQALLSWGRLTILLVIPDIREVLQNEFRYDFRKCPREISAGTVITVLTAIMHVNTVNTVPAEISRGPFRKSYRNSFCKTSLLWRQFSFSMFLLKFNEKRSLFCLFVRFSTQEKASGRQEHKNVSKYHHGDHLLCLVQQTNKIFCASYFVDIQRKLSRSPDRRESRSPDVWGCERRSSRSGTDSSVTE